MLFDVKLQLRIMQILIITSTFTSSNSSHRYHQISVLFNCHCTYNHFITTLTPATSTTPTTTLLLRFISIASGTFYSDRPFLTRSPPSISLKEHFERRAVRHKRTMTRQYSLMPFTVIYHLRLYESSF